MTERELLEVLRWLIYTLVVLMGLRQAIAWGVRKGGSRG